MLLVPLLVLAPIYLRLERGHRLRLPLAVLIAFFLVVELRTLSRSGLLGLAVGTLVLAVPYRRYLLSRALLAAARPAAALLGWCRAAAGDFFEVVIRSRVDTSGGRRRRTSRSTTSSRRSSHSIRCSGSG